MTESAAFHPDVIDGAARAWATAVAHSFAADPTMRVRSAQDAYVVFSGGPLAISNGVFSYGRRLDAALLEGLAAEVATLTAVHGTEAPWCVLMRSDPTPEVLAVAAEHGLTQAVKEPFMVWGLDGPGLPVPSGSELRILSGGDDTYDAFVATLSETVGMPRDTTARLFSPAYVGTEEATVYVGRVDGVPVVTGMGLLRDGYVGISAITTHPEHRKRGYARQMVEHIMREGHEAGAGTVYLRSTDMAFSLYSSMGFQVAEHWTTLTA